MGSFFDAVMCMSMRGWRRRRWWKRWEQVDERSRVLCNIGKNRNSGGKKREDLGVKLWFEGVISMWAGRGQSARLHQ